MKFSFRNTGIYYDSIIRSESGTDILFIHGFTGNGTEWEPVISYFGQGINAHIIDLPGAGSSDIPDDKSFYNSEGLTELIRKFIGLNFKKRPVLCGYSMGGRLAFSYAVKYSDTLSGLIIESSTPGIRNLTDRMMRRDSDAELIRSIRIDGVPKFIGKWLRTGIFAGLDGKLGADLFSGLIQKRSANSETGLIRLLEGFGTGEMKPVWDDLEKIDVPVLLVAGEEDSKYKQILSEVNNVIKSSELKIVGDAGHNVHLEKPSEFSKIINDFIKNIK